MSEQMLQDLFERATDLAADERAAFLRQACGTDTLLLHEVEALLAADAHAAQETFWQHSALRNQVIADGAARNDVGQIVGNYRLVQLLGKGGMGAVYRAERMDATYEKSVAIKLINGLFHSADVINHFRAERQILANLEHPNIARLLDGGTRADGLPYLVMEYVEGSGPYDYCRTHNLATAARLTLFRQICAAVHFAHQNMVIHRDLKPANILVTEDGTPKLLDFGIAKVLNPDPLRTGDAPTEPGMLKLTARYASPEQVRGEPVTSASDVYSLGVILYELLSGHSPYGDSDRPPHRWMTAVCDEDPPRPSIWEPRLKGDLDNIILRALRKAPGDRYASADRFSEDILRHLEARPVEARGDAPFYVAARFVRRNRVAAAAAGLLLCALVGGIVEVSLARARADRRFNDVRRLAHSVIFDYADAIDRLPGSTPVRKRLVEDALTYLDSLSREADTPGLRREIVDAYVRISNLQGNEYQNNLGDTAGASASAHKAVDAAEALLRKDRGLPALDSAASAFSTSGSLHYAGGDLQGADRDYQRAVELRHAISQQSSQDIQNQIALATCLDHLGDLYGGVGFHNLGKTPEALAYYLQAKSLVTALAAQEPGNLDVAKERYETLLSLSSAENAAARHPEAVTDLGAAMTEIAKVGRAEPHDTNVQYELANGQSRLGQMLIDDRDFKGAVPCLAQSAALLRTLLLTDAANAVFRRAVSVVETQWAAALRGAGHPQEGLVHNEEALRIAQDLSRDAPSSAQYKTDVGINERKLADGLLAAGRATDAAHHANLAIGILCENADSATNAANATHCGRAYLASGNALLSANSTKEAAAALEHAVTIATARIGSDPLNAILRSDAARAQSALASAFARDHDTARARTSLQAALANWLILHDRHALSPEDAYRSHEAENALEHLR